MKVLIVEDSRINLRQISSIVSKMGHDIVTAHNGKEAITAFKSENPDIILMDVMMPEMDGYEAARHIKKLVGNRWVPLIFLTAMTEAEDLAEGIDAGGDDYLAKPVNKVILTAKIKAMSRIAAMQKELFELTEKLESANKKLEALSKTDPLTKIPNKRHFSETFEKEWGRAIRNKTSLALLLIDIDFFKKYNDHYGHMQGDWCLKSVAQGLAETLRRPADFIARFGGEEFIAILPENNTEQGKQVAENMVEHIRSLNIPHVLSETASCVTVSIGVSSVIPTTDAKPDDLISKADEALYHTKQHGRNGVSTL